MRYTSEAIKKRKEKRSRIKNLVVSIIYILLIPMLIYNVSLITQAIIKPDETPNFLGIKMYVIVSGSMKPELEIGDIIIVKNTKAEELQEEDIISFRRGQTVVTHRITEILELEGEKQFRTKGDSNNVEDAEYVREKEIEGKVIKKIPTIGKIILLLNDKIIIIVIVIFYYIYLLHDQSLQKRKTIRKMKREEHETKKNRENEDAKG